MTKLLMVGLLATVSAHIAMYDPSIYDCDRGSRQSNQAAQPLEDMDFDVWWWHGALDCPPFSGSKGIKLIPSRGQFTIAMSSNRNHVPNQYCGFNNCRGWRPPGRENDMERPGKPWDAMQFHNYHTYDHRNGGRFDTRELVSGCAIAISYKSNRRQVGQNDFVIFSVVRDCPAHQRERFRVPALKKCPNDMCQCAWFWIHSSRGGSVQMYMTAFQCRVTGNFGNNDVDFARAIPPRRCWNPTDCNFGPRLPMYWRNNEPAGRNNMPEDRRRAPTYSVVYGFRDGAQNDIFIRTNPNRIPVRVPSERRCDGKRSRATRDRPLTGNSVLTSPNCRMTIRMGSRFELRQGSNSLYRSNNLGGASPYTLRPENDGRLRIRDSRSSTRWQTKYTRGWGQAPYRLEATNTGMVFYDGTGLDLWENPFTDRRTIDFDARKSDPSVWRNLGQPPDISEFVSDDLSEAEQEEEEEDVVSNHERVCRLSMGKASPDPCVQVVRTSRYVNCHRYCRSQSYGRVGRHFCVASFAVGSGVMAEFPHSCEYDWLREPQTPARAMACQCAPPLYAGTLDKFSDVDEEEEEAALAPETAAPICPRSRYGRLCRAASLATCRYAVPSRGYSCSAFCKASGGTCVGASWIKSRNRTRTPRWPRNGTSTRWPRNGTSTRPRRNVCDRLNDDFVGTPDLCDTQPKRRGMLDCECDVPEKTAVNACLSPRRGTWRKDCPRITSPTDAQTSAPNNCYQRSKAVSGRGGICTCPATAGSPAAEYYVGFMRTAESRRALACVGGTASEARGMLLPPQFRGMKVTCGSYCTEGDLPEEKEPEEDNEDDVDDFWDDENSEWTPYENAVNDIYLLDSDVIEAAGTSTLLPCVSVVLATFALALF